MPAVARLATTPVKGTALHHPAAVRLTADGAVGNRRFHLVDERGHLLNGKQCGPLVQVRAELDGDELAVHVPGQDPVRGSASGRGDALTVSFYGRDVPGHVVTGPFAAAIGAHAGREVRLVATDVPGAAVDVHPVTIVSTATLEHLRRVTPGGEQLDHRRFRMLVEVDGCDVHEEDTWAGRRVRLGEAVVRVVGPVPRCVITNQSPDTGEVDFRTLKAIVRYRGELAATLDTPVAHLPDGGAVILGMYAVVEQPGSVAVGDVVADLDAVPAG